MMLFLENINLFNHSAREKHTDRQTDTQTDRQTEQQTGLLWQYGAMHHSALHGKNEVVGDR